MLILDLEQNSQDSSGGPLTLVGPHPRHPGPHGNNNHGAKSRGIRVVLHRRLGADPACRKGASPLCRSRRKYFQSAQGSSSGPLSGRVRPPYCSGAPRLSCRHCHLNRKHRKQSQLYVDDPAIATQGTQEVRDEVVTVAVMVRWLKLAVSRAQRRTDLIWIGAQVHSFPDRVIASIRQEKLAQYDAGKEFWNVSLVLVFVVYVCRYCRSSL